MKRLLLVLVVLACSAGVVGATTLSDYNNYTTFYYNITAAMGSQTDYQVKFILSNSSGISGYYAPDNIIYTNGTTRADWYDVNATDGMGTPLPFWIENNTYTAYNATAWAKVPTIATSNTSAGRWYYGNASQSASTMSGINTFLLFDDFDDASLNATLWKTVGTVTVTGGVASVTGGTSTWSVLNSSPTTFPRNSSIRANAKYYGKDTAKGSLIAFRASPDATEYTDLLYFNVNQLRSQKTGLTVVTTNIDTNTNVYDLKWGLSPIIATKNDVAMTGSPMTVADANLSGGPLPVQFQSMGGAAYKLDLRWVTVRKTVPTEPTTSLYTTTSASPTADPISASFISSSNPSTTNTPVTFTDTSTGTPTTWNWTIDGSVTNTTQNIAYTFASSGTHPVDLNVTNATGHFSNYTLNQVVTNATGFTPQDIWMTGQYLQTFTITDSGTLAPITNVTIVSSSGKTYTTTNGTGYLTEPFGSYTVIFSADGYNPRTIAYVFDSEASHAVSLTKASTPRTESRGTVWIPQQVRFRLYDETMTPIGGAKVTATPLNFTAPANWTDTLFGIDPSLNIVNSSLVGITGSDGSWAAPMLASIQYQFVIEKGSTIDYTLSLFPSQSEYVWIIPSSTYVPIPTISNVVSYSLANVTINSTAQFLNATYADTSSGGTNTLKFAVYNNSGAEVYSESYSGPANCAAKSFSYTAVGGNGQSFTYGIFSSQSQYGWINRTETVTWRNQIALIGEAPSWVEYWLSVGLILITAACFGLLAKRFMLLAVSILAWFLQYYMGWFDIGLGGTMFFAMLFILGGLIYIRESENKLS